MTTNIKVPRCANTRKTTGDWGDTDVSNKYNKDCQYIPSKCTDYVKINSIEYKEAYWKVTSLKVYQNFPFRAPNEVQYLQK